MRLRDNCLARKNNFSLTVFDLDHTLFSVNTSIAYYFFLLQKKVFSLSSLIPCSFYFFRYSFFRMSPEDFHQKIFSSVLKGKSSDLIFSFVSEFFRKKLSKLLYLPALKALEQAQKNQETILLLSQSPKQIVAVIGKSLDISYFGASEYSIDQNKKFTHIHQLMGGSEKAIFLKNFLNEHKNFKNITVYSDSFFDLPLFNLATRKIAVNPDRKLKKMAIRDQWEIL